MEGDGQTGGTFVGAFCFPHGAITLDPDTRDFANVPAATDTSKLSCVRLHDEMLKQARLLMATKPNLIILSTPHGLAIDDGVPFYGNSTVTGSAEWDGEWAEFKATANVDAEGTLAMVKSLKAMENPVNVLNLADPVETPLPLAWGEAIPLWFINEAAKEGGAELPSVILIGRLLRMGVPPLDAKISAILKLGGDCISYLVNNGRFCGKRVAVVVSSDLAHTHSEAPSAPYPYDPSSGPFDAMISEWAKATINKENLEEATSILTERAASIVLNAGSCGFAGLVLIQGMMHQLITSGVVRECKGTLEYYSAPTYYGMMVHNFLPV